MVTKKTTVAKTTEIKHDLIPKHTKLPSKEKEELYKKYNLTGRELPLILKEDLAIAHLGVESGDVIKIERQSPTAGTALFYRLVVSK